MSKRSRKGGARNPPAVEVPTDQITEDMKCQFCKQGETKDILQSGKLYKLVSGRTAEYYHYFCCLFSTDGVQAGKDEEGLNGFLVKDLKQELKRGANLRCDLCGKTGATIRCGKKSCKKMYHFSCGALSPTGEYFYIFLGEMTSFCELHGPRQKVSGQLCQDKVCMICFDTCGETPGPGPGRLVSPCCGRTYHRACVQKTALQAGKAALKCPACNDKETFNTEMERCGVYIPNADAQWEMPENSNFYQFEEMLGTDLRCDSLLCQCPHGPEFSRPGGRFEIAKCQTCGGRGVHIQCGNIDTKTKLFICSDCQPETVDSDTNSEEEDQLVQEKIMAHEKIMKEKVAERDRLMKEQREWRERRKSEQERRIEEIKSILRDPDPTPTSSTAHSSHGWRGGRGGNTMFSKGPPRLFIVSNGEEARYATNLPRKHPSSNDNKVPDNDDNDEDLLVLDQSSNPVIESVCGGSEAKRLNDTVTEDSSIEIFDESDDSDLEVIETKKKKQVCSEISNQILTSSEESEEFIPIE